MSPRSRFVVRALLLFPLSVLGLACSSSSSTAVVDGGAGIVMGDADNHCMGVAPIMTSQASCHVGADASAPGDDGGASDDAGAGGDDFTVYYGSVADDDDCKYHVSFTTTPVLVDTAVTFNVTVTKLAENVPATGADVVLESYMADNKFHIIPNNGTVTTETPSSSGKYVM
jgi:hypothetical protein